MSRRYPLLSVLGLLAPVLAACGGSGTPAPPTPSATTPTTPTTATTSAPPAAAVTSSVFYVGDTSVGARLFPEARRFTCGGAGCYLDAVGAAVAGGARDPDYATAWPVGSAVRSVTVTGGTITVDLRGDVHDRPPGMTRTRAGLAIEQVLFTAQAAVGKGRLPVQLLLGGKHTDTVLGVPTAEPLAAGRVLATETHVSLASPAEGAIVSGHLDVRGAANSFEANVVLRLQRWEGTYIAFQKPVTASGWQGDRLYPFHARFDVSKLQPGKYVLMAMTDDPSGRGQSFSDTKVIEIR